MATNYGADWTLDGLNNPLLIQARLLDRLENVTGTAVVDPNNPASVLIEGFADTTAGVVRNMEQNVRPAIYAARANNATDLYKHLSDYDYIDVFASPAETTLQMVVDKIYVMLHSVPVPGTDYNKIVIPASTRFTVGTHSFGIYYPIEIRSSRATGRFSVVYDTSVKNPLKSLSNNALEYDIKKYSGHDLVFIKIPVYQFDVTHLEQALVGTSGLRMVVPYTDKFYAIKCRAEVLQNPGHDDTEEAVYAEQELKLCCSGQVYDPNEVTVVFTPDLENNECIIEVPFIYFSQEMIRTMLYVDLYTTEGEITYNVPIDSEEVCTIDMFTQLTDEETATYADPFKKMPALQVMPCTATISGGRNGMDFATLKQRIVTGTIKDKTLQTPDDIDAYFANRGYVTTLLRDGVTDRIFQVHATVKNTLGEVIGADAIGTLFDFRDEVRKDYDTIVQSGANTYTIYPSTIYKLDVDKGICTPLKAQERRNLLDLLPADKVAEFNNNIYTVSPYHLQVDVSSKYPSSVTYDMTDSGIVGQEFIGDRVEPSCQLIMNQAILSRERGEIKDFYRITIRVSRAGLDDVNAVVPDGDMIGRKNFRCIIGLKNDDGTFYFGEAVWDNWTGEYDIFHIDLDTEYKFHQANNNHTLVMKIGNNPYTDVFLTAEVRVMLLINGDIPGVRDVLGPDEHCIDTDFTSAGNGIIDSVQNYFALSENKLMCKFGSVINEIDQRVNLAYSEMQFLRYPTTKFKTIDVPIYERNPDGSLKFKDDEFRMVTTTDTEYDESKVYYVLDGDKYAMYQGWHDVSPVAKGLFEMQRKAVLNELFPAGTMTCLTKTAVDSIVLNDNTVDNYIGCTANYRRNDGTTVEGHVIDDDSPNITRGIALSIQDAPIVPRFSITSAEETVDEASPVVGRYELITKPASVAKVSATSNPFMLWCKTGLDGKVTIDPDTGAQTYTPYNCSVRATDALYHQFGTVLGSYSSSEDGPTSWLQNTDLVIEATNPADPITNFKATVGTIVVVTNDMTAYDDEVPELYPLSEEQRANVVPRAVGYYCYAAVSTNGVVSLSSWTPVFQGGSAINVALRVYQLTQDANYKHSFGGAYVVTGMSINDEGVVAEQNYLAYLNTTAVDGNPVPDFTEFDMCQRSDLEELANDETTVREGYTYFACTYKEDEESGMQILTSCNEIFSNIGKALKPGDTIPTPKAGTVVRKATITDTYRGWTDRVHAWPWDAKVWMFSVTGTANDQPVTCYTPTSKVTTAFDHVRLDRYCEYTTGQYWLKDGELQEAEDGARSVQYLIDMIQIDAKMGQTTENKSTREFPTNVTDIIREHCDLIGKCRQSMFTNTRLFFSPCKSIGKAEFDVGDGLTSKIRMDVSVGFKLYVTPAVTQNVSLLENIRSTIIEIIDRKIESSHILNCPDVAAAIVEQLSESILRVDVMGINGNVDLQTIKCVDKEAQVHLGHQLQLLSDGNTIDIGRALNLEIVTVDE